MATVTNMDVAGLAEKFAIFANELRLSQSTGQIELNVHDQKRARVYLEYISKYMTWMCEPADPLDLPKAHPSTFIVRDFLTAEEIGLVENPIIKDILRRFNAAYIELVQGQSKDRSSSLTAPDRGRIESLIENCLGIVEFGVAGLDVPENPGDTGPTPSLLA
jgi:hypothetical protein